MDCMDACVYVCDDYVNFRSRDTHTSIDVIADTAFRKNGLSSYFNFAVYPTVAQESSHHYLSHNFNTKSDEE